jgi:hypothetical protein
MGVLSLPPDDAKTRDAAVVILSAGLLHRVGPFRLNVDLARCLATAGFATLRLDQAGRGDSTRSEGLTSQETVQQELLAAGELIKTRTGIEKLIVVGLCSGADDALASIEFHENIMGIILLDGFAARTWRYFVTYYMSRLGSPARVMKILGARVRRLRTRIAGTSTGGEVGLAELSGVRDFPDLASARKAFGHLFERGGIALCIFTNGVGDYYCQHGQLRSNLGLDKNDDRLTEVFYPEANHTYPTVAHRKRMVRLAVDWCDQYFK